MKKTLVLCLAAAFLCACNQNVTIPLVYSEENTGAAFESPVLLSFEDLTRCETLPDPLEWSDGSGRVQNFSQWEKRRNEIMAELYEYEVGWKPATPKECTQARVQGDTLLIVEVTVNDSTIAIECPVILPPTEGPHPAVIGLGYDPRFPFMRPGPGSLPREIFESRDIAIICFPHSAVMSHTQVRGEEPVNGLYPEYVENGAYSMWPWGVSRVIDGLEKVQDVLPIDLKHLAITGCSYAGKMALWSGALDERIALTIAQEPGGGGAAAWRYTETLGWVERLGATNYSWFKESMKQFEGENVSKLPMDHHELCALVAPRALLVFGNTDYEWLADESGYVSCVAARKVWEEFGIADRMGYSIQGGHPHCRLPEEQYADVECFVDKFLLGKDVETNVTKAPMFEEVDTESWMMWENALAVNPIGYTDVPDPDIVRVGEDFYMVSTTMYFCPMVPICHSRDLVHWEIISYVDDCIAPEDDCYTFKNGKNAYGKGQWATSLQYHDGYFYVLFVANDQHKSYIYRTADPYQSNWEQVSVLDKNFFHDASLLFDNDGRVYVVYGNTDIHVTELRPDLTAVLEGGLDKVVFSEDRSVYMLGAEGSRFYHIGEYYYDMVIDWPRGGIRTERCYRSKNIEGPYEEMISCDGTLGGLTAGIAQGPLFDTANGDWYAFLFQDHGGVGRIPTLQPVTWVDGWPICGKDTKPLETVRVKLPASGRQYLYDDDEFSGKTLPLVWQWNHQPIDDAWSLKARKGWLRLTTAQLATGLSDARNTLTQRTFGPKSVAETRMDASGMKAGDYAGLCAFQSNRAMVGVKVGEDGKKMISVCSEAPAPRIPAGMVLPEGIELPKGGLQEVYSEELQSDVVYLRISYDFNKDVARFSFSYDNKTWKEADYELHMRFTLDYFTGYRSALFNYATSELGGYADFDWFHQYAK